MISGTIAGSSSFTVYPLGEITITRPSYSYYYIAYSPSTASGTMWIASSILATPVSYQISSYSGMLKFGDSYPQYLSFESCTWRRIETNIPLFNQTSAFAKCSTLQKADLYKCTSLSSWAFYSCSSLLKVSLPMCEHIGYWVFHSCSSLLQVSLPMCSEIGAWAFEGCYSLSQVSLPICKYVGDGAFEECSSLSQVNLPVCKYLLSSVFKDCSSLKQVSLPVCSLIWNFVFHSCTSLLQVSLPLCETIGAHTFEGCYSLSQVNLPMCSYIGDYAFEECSSLRRITIGYSSVCNLGIGVFSGTRITPSTGSIYVPASLVSAYKSANGWLQYSAIIQSYPGL